VIEDKEKQAMKDEQKSTIQNSHGEEYLSPSTVDRRPMCLLQTLKDVREAPMSGVKECMPSRKFPNYLVLISGIIDVDPSNFEEVAYQ